MTTPQEIAKNWFVGVSFKQELFSEYMIQRGHRHTGSHLGLSRPINYRKYVDNDICGVREDWEDYAEEVRSNYQEHLPRMFDIVKTASNSFIEFSKNINAKQLGQLSNQELATVFLDFCEYYEKAAGLIAMPFLGEMALVPALKERIGLLLQEKGMSFAEFARIVSLPSTETVIVQERTDLLEIAKEIYHSTATKQFFQENSPAEIIKYTSQQDKKLLQTIEEHSAQYLWILKTLLQGEDYTPQNVVERLKYLIQENPQEKIEMAAQEKEKRIKEINTIMEWLPQEYVQDVDLLQELIYFRDARLMWLNEGCHYSFPLFQEIAKKLDLTFEEVIYLLPEEIEEGLKGTLPLTKEEIRKRMDKYALVMENHQITLYTGEEVEQQRVKTSFPNALEVKGHPAFQGKVTGKVKLVKDRSELHKVEKGDILVTKLTTPDFVVAMEKAAAIVTDLGGITSHAAIISRELGIPCVVGTETATTIFKDGDVVEVDAEMGMVRKVGSGEEDQRKNYYPTYKERFQRVTKVLNDPLTQYLICEGTLKYWSKHTGFPFNYSYVEADYVIYYNKESRALTQEALTLNSWKIEEFFILIGALHREYVRWCKQASQKNFKKFSGEELKLLWKEFQERYQEVLSIIYLPFDIEVVLHKQIKLALPPPLNNDKIIQKISTPAEPSEGFRQRKELLELAVALKKDPARKEILLQEHYKKFSWLNVLTLRGRPYTLESFRQGLEKEIKDNPELKYQQLIENTQKQEEEGREILADINVSEEARKLISNLRTIIYLRTWRLEQICEGNALLQPLLEEIANRNGYTYDEIIFMLPSEIDELFVGKRIIQDILEKRQNCWGIIFEQDAIQFLEGEEAREFSYCLEEKSEEKVLAVKGQIACQGIVQGRVKIVRQKEDLSKIGKGDILVTEMTTPDFVMAMARAAAIVTDIGGITCHAAIVSREMNKPCLIGTEIATKVFKDGDLVEVDAEQGVVRKIDK